VKHPVIVPKSTRKDVCISFSNTVKLTEKRVEEDYAMGHSSSRRRVLLEEPVEKFLAFFENKGSLPFSQ